MVNLANCFEKQQKYAKAVTWYDFALSLSLNQQLSVGTDDAYYGIALCYIKDGDAQRALDYIQEAMKQVEDKHAEDKIHLVYMKALCLRILKRYKDADEAYKSMSRSFNREEGNKIAKYIFGMILMPLETNRMVS